MEWGEEIKQRRIQEHGALFAVGMYCTSEGAVDSDPPLATILATLRVLVRCLPLVRCGSGAALPEGVHWTLTCSAPQLF